MPQTLESPSGRGEYDRVPVLRDSPNGPVWVYGYDPNDEEGKKERTKNAQNQRDELQLRRMAERAGISMSEARSLVGEDGSVQGIRDLAIDRRREDKEARRKAYTDRNMLAGNDPRQNLVNAYNTLDPEMQQQAMLGMMFPDGATPLDVQQARAAAEARLNVADALSPDPMRDEMMRQQLDQQNPAAAGVRHISEGNYESPEAQKEFERLAESYDADLFGMSYEQRDAMAETLQQPPYNMDQGAAEAAAYRYTRSRMYMPGAAPGQDGYVPPGSGMNVPPGGPQRPPNGWR